MHSERYRVDPSVLRACARPAPRAAGWWPSARRRVRALETRRARRPAGPHPAVHPPAVRLAGGRRAAHQLPPAPHHAADDGRRLRRAPLARPLRHAARARATASCPSATPCCSERRRDRPGHAARSSARDGAARTGVATTARGTYRTPCFMPVGTRGAVKHLSAADYERLGAEIVLANTYHLMLRPGADVGGRARRARAASPAGTGLTLTDSGGFQVFSLDPDVDDDGVTFRSVYDGSSHRLTPELRGGRPGAARRRHPDGARRLPAAARRRPRWCALAVERTAAWAKRARASAPPRPTRRCSGSCRAAPTRPCAPRAPSARSSSTSTATASAGCRWGRPATEMLPALAAALAELPDDRPRYLMGVGDPASLVEAVGARRRPVRLRAADPAGPPRHRPHGGGARSAPQRLPTPAPTSPSTPTCACAVCRRHCRGYLRHLFQVGEPTRRPAASRCTTWPGRSPWWSGCRAAIADGGSPTCAREVLATWG